MRNNKSNKNVGLRQCYRKAPGHLRSDEVVWVMHFRVRNQAICLDQDLWLHRRNKHQMYKVWIVELEAYYPHWNRELCGGGLANIASLRSPNHIQSPDIYWERSIYIFIIKKSWKRINTWKVWRLNEWANGSSNWISSEIASRIDHKRKFQMLLVRGFHLGGV